MIRKLLFTCVFALLSFGMAWAQKIQVTGRVTDSTGEGIPGATIREKGTTNGVSADYNGVFSIKVADRNAILIISSIGYAAQEVKVGNQTAVNILLGEDTQQLDEVVVVGYGEAKKASFTGTATKVDSEKITSKSVANVGQALAGEVAGVQIINESGQPGESPKIRIRGYGSVNGNRDPLYVVDGLPYNGDIVSINPSDIESLTILKDASATAIYGSRGANGVIVITTNSGSTNSSDIEAEIRYGTNMRLLPDYDVISSPEEYVELTWNSLYNQAAIIGSSDPAAHASESLFAKKGGISPFYNMWNAVGKDLIDPATGKFRSGISRKYTPEEWRDYLFDNSSRVEANVKLSGGTDKTKYFTSFGFLDDIGYYVGSDFMRLTGRVNVSHQIRPWLEGSMNMGYTHSERNSPGQGGNIYNGFSFVTSIPAIYPVFLRDKEGKLVADPVLGGNLYDYGSNVEYGKRAFAAFSNPVQLAKLDKDRRLVNEVSGNGLLKAKITDYLSASTRFGMQFRNDDGDAYSNPFYGSAAGSNGSISKEKYQKMSYTWLKMLNFDKSFGDHNVSAFVAHENTSYEYKYLYVNKTNIADPFGMELDNAVVQRPASSYIYDYKLESYFGQVKYDFSEKYFIHGVVRRDGSSRFLGDNKWGTFASVGLAWVATQEDFLSSLDWLSFLKLKASYGTIGDQGGKGTILSRGRAYYPGYDFLEIQNNNDQIAISFHTKGNKNLTWEKSNIFQTGAEFELFDRVNVSLDYYIKNTDALFFDKRVAPSLGYAIVTVNDGQMQNRGLEFAVDAKLLQTEDFKLNFSLNGSFEGNEITKMPIETATGKPKVIDVDRSLYGRSEGHSMFDFYMREFAGVDQQTGKSLWTKHYYMDGEKKVEIKDWQTDIAKKPSDAKIEREFTDNYYEATVKYVGKSVVPDVRGAFRLQAEYKGISLSAQFMYSLGGYAYDRFYSYLMNNGKVGADNWHTDIRNRWQKPGDITDVPRLSNGQDTNVASISSRFITKSDYLALNNLRLGYTLPKSLTDKLSIRKLQVWVSGDNLWFMSERKGFNPVTSESGLSSVYRYSPLSTITGGLKVNF